MYNNKGDSANKNHKNRELDTGLSFKYSSSPEKDEPILTFNNEINKMHSSSATPKSIEDTITIIGYSYHTGYLECLAYNNTDTV